MTAIPRPVHRGERVVSKRADELTADDYGLIVQHPGNRGWLLNAGPDGSGTWVCTSTGVAVYPDDAVFHLWGFDDPRRCVRHVKPNCRECRMTPDRIAARRRGA